MLNFGSRHYTMTTKQIFSAPFLNEKVLARSMKRFKGLYFMKLNDNPAMAKALLWYIVLSY